VENDPAYPGQKMNYDAVPLYTLFEGLKIDPTDTLMFSCLDGFSAPLLSTRLLNSNPNKSVAYIAIEPASERWPRLKPNSAASAGPFYLVWDNPKASNIGTEEWPYQLAGFVLKPSIEAQFPNTVPSQSLHAESTARQGYKLFIKNCFACHTMNGQGASQIGPDLNLPHNPTEYFSPTFLRKLIRDPQSVRLWPESKMKGFDRSMLSDKELQSIISYLQHMSSRKRAP